MIHWLPERTKDVARQETGLAEDFISPRTELHTLQKFPPDIWDELGRAGLLGINISGEYRGLSCGYLELAVAGDALARSGKNLGIVLTWLIHHLTAGVLIQNHANNSLPEANLSYLPSGKSTAVKRWDPNWLNWQRHSSPLG